jgi:mannose-6-phosphate isomerase-like protein (cupin superfamily)
MQLTVKDSLEQLAESKRPHTRDELYVVVAGTGKYFVDAKTVPCQAGDVLFAAAGAEHRFLDFTEDFSTWVIFYGPEGGEKAIIE